MCQRWAVFLGFPSLAHHPTSAADLCLTLSSATLSPGPGSCSHQSVRVCSRSAHSSATGSDSPPSGVTYHSSVYCVVNTLQTGQGKLCPPAPFPAPAPSHGPAEVCSSAWLPGPAWGGHHASSAVPIPGPSENLHTDRVLLSLMPPPHPANLGLGSPLPILRALLGDSTRSLDLSSSWSRRPHGDHEETRTCDVPGTPRQRWVSFGALAHCNLW